MNYNELKKELMKDKKKYYLSNLYKKEHEYSLKLTVYEGGVYFGRPFCNLEMDNSGKILNVSYHNQKPKKSLKLVGKKFDLTSFTWDYQKIVHDKWVSNDSSTIVGYINEKGNFIRYNKNNLSKIIFPNKFRSNNDELREYGNYESTNLFLDFVKKHKKEISSFSIHNDSITFYIIEFKINGIDVHLELNQFFNYSLETKVYHKEKGFLLLKDAEILNIDETIDEFKNGIIKPENVMKIILQSSDVKYYTATLIEDEKYQVNIKFDGYKKKYDFIFDLKNKNIYCDNDKNSYKLIYNQTTKFMKKLNFFKS